MFSMIQMSASGKWLDLVKRDPSKEQEFRALPADAKVAFVYDFLGFKFFPEVLCSSDKYTADALKHKILGNEFFSQGNYVEALQMYTLSVSAALPESPELAVAYANRSAALFRLGRYMACLVDINRALKGQYLDASKPKLIKRKENCVSKLEAMKTNTLNHLKSIASSAADDDDTLKENIKYKMAEVDFDVDATDLNYANKFYLPSTNFKNDTIPFASEKIKLNHNSSMGRHIVSTSDIQPGEVLSFERAYASILKFKFHHSHCSNCFVRCEALIPCKKCATVMYCSDECREEALNRYHLIECPILQNAVAWEMDESTWLSVRMLLIATKQGQELDALMTHPVYKNPMKRTDMNFAEKFDSQDYLNIHNMEMNLDKHSDRNLYQCSVVAAFLLNNLKSSEYFGFSNNDEVQKTGPNVPDKEAFVGGLLLKFFLNLMCNSQGILEASKTNTPGISRLSIETTTIGTGIYSFHCIYNHSCDANVTIHSHKDTIVFCSNQPIKAGEQVFSNYGGFFYDVPRDERQNSLRRNFFFDCHCKACKKNWPEWMRLESLIEKKKPPFKGKELYRHQEKMQKWQKKISEEDLFSTEVLRALREMLLYLLQTAEKPFLQQVECQYSIRLLFWCRANCYEHSRDKLLLSL